MMRLSKVLGVRRIKIRNRIFSLGIIITGMLSLTFGVITFYGQNAGNMIMSVDPSAALRGIRISTDGSDDAVFTQTRLMSEPIEDAKDITFAWVKLDEVQETDGNYIDVDHDYVAYTFYVKNEGAEAVDLRYYIKIVGEPLNNLDEGVRVIVIEDGETSLFMKADKNNDSYYPDTMPVAEHFLSKSMVMRKIVPNFRPGQIIKFSVIIYLEGYDPDTTDDLMGGSIKMQMNFAIDDDYEEFE